VDASPALDTNGVVYFGSWDKNFYALNLDGSKKWQFPTAGEIVSSAAIGSDGTIYFGSHDKSFYALTPGGQKRWNFATGGPIISSPALGTDCVYFTSVDGFCYALNLDGSLRWRLRTGGITDSSPVLGADVNIFVGVNDRLWTISAQGEKKEERPDGARNSPLAFADGSIGFLGGIMVLMDKDRQPRWIIELDYYGGATPAVGPTGVIYTLSGENFIALKNTVPLARTSWPKFRGNAANTGCPPK